MKKIIFVSQGLAIGGIEVALINTLNRMDYSKYDVYCLLLSSQNHLESRITEKCKIRYIDRYETISFSSKYKYAALHKYLKSPYKKINVSIPAKISRSLFRMVLRWFENVCFLRYVRKLLSGEEYDVAVAYKPLVAECTVKCVKAKKRLMFYHHGDIQHVYHEKVGYYKCNGIIAVSNGIKNMLLKEFPRLRGKIDVIKNINDTNYILAKSNEFIPPLKNDKYYNIVSCGRLEKEKGFHLAIDACKLLVDAGYTNIRWYIVGGGRAHNELSQQILLYGLQENFIVLGWKENPYPYIKACDLYVQPSLIEAYGLTIAEAQILKKVVLSTNTIGAQELIEDGKSGFICDISADAISGRIMQIINNYDIYEAVRNRLSTMDFKKQNKESMDYLEVLLDG